jgi:hypothetical protein
MFLMNYLDRINVSNARIAGLQEDLGMTDTIWSAGISTFYVGFQETCGSPGSVRVCFFLV